MERPNLTITTGDNKQYDLSGNFVDLKTSVSADAFCSTFTARVFNPGLSYSADIGQGCTIHCEMTNPQGDRVTFSGQIDRVHTTPGDVGSPGKIILRGRGIEAELVDAHLKTGGKTVEHVGDGLESAFALLARLGGLARWESYHTNTSPDIEPDLRIGIANATVFEALRDIADHVGYSFHYDHRQPSFNWVRPDVVAITVGKPYHMLTRAHVGSGIATDQHLPEVFYEDLDEWQ